MPASVNMHEAKTHFSKLAERVHAGEEIIVAKAGTPFIKLVPLDPVPKAKRQPGGLEVWKDIPDSVWFDPMSDEDLDLWEGKGRLP